MRTLSLRWLTSKARQTGLRPRASDPPLRAELFGVEQLARHARTLAASHPLVARRGASRLLARLDENERILRGFNRATLAVGQRRRVTPAAEWLLDNFYLIEEQIQMARRHLPRGYSRELPRLANGPSAGLPRVYDIVLELISHVDAQIDAGPLSAFIAAYQTVVSLKLGGLWAIPIMLRLGLIENLQRITTRLILARRDRDLAERWVGRLQDMAESHPSHLVVVVADMAKSDLPLSSSFVAEFCQRLSRQSPALHLARAGLEQRAMTGRFPENAILSRDLLEACHARSGLVSDVEFYEEHPSRHNVDIDRRHRWIRGDWQITQWLLHAEPALTREHLLRDDRLEHTVDLKVR